METNDGNASPGNLLGNKRPDNKHRQRSIPNRLEQQLTKKERTTKLPLVGALVHKAVRARDCDSSCDPQQQQQQPATSQLPPRATDSNNNNNNETMVLPFGLDHDGNSLDAIHVAPAPSAPPAPRQAQTPQPKSNYSRGQTNIYCAVPIIKNAYIDFIVVNGDDRYMIRCERKCILERSVELAKLLDAGPNSGRKGDNHFQVSNVDKHDFELVVRYIEKRFLPYRDHKHLLRILELADRFNVPDLIIYCIRELDLSISSASALDIYKALWFYQGIALTNQHETMITTQETGKQKFNRERAKVKAMAKAKEDAKAAALAQGLEPGADGDCNQSQLIPNPNPFTTEDCGVALLHNTLQLIDMQAELVLTLPQMKELRYEELETLVKRDTLQLRTEMTLFDCIADWSIAECMRKNLDPTPDNRQMVLGPLCVMPRYLRLNLAEFKRCCERVELLPPRETALIYEILDGKKPKNLTDQQTALFERLRAPRAEWAQMPVHLSDRSNHKNYPKKMRLAAEGRSDEEGCWEKIGINCLRVFVCIFD